MPRGFTEQEKAVIQRSLLEHGRAFLATYGMRKTSVDDLTKAAGISKGAFYAFFASKEELFLAILEQFEATYRRELLGFVDQCVGTPRERMRTFLLHAVTLWRTQPLFRHFGKDAYAYLARKTSPERWQELRAADERFVADLLECWRIAGLPLACDAAEFTSLIRALFFMSLHADDFEDHSYTATITLLADLIAGYLVEPE